MRLFFLSVVLVFSCGQALCQQDYFTDARDGKTYRTIVIGEQTWMAENLSYSKELSHKSNLFLDNMDIYCYNDDTNNCKKYGMLYNWEAAQKSCPAGWHLPSKDEFRILLSNYKNPKMAYKALTESGSSGFEAKFGAWTAKYGFMGLGNFGYFWSSTISKRKNEAYFLAVTRRDAFRIKSTIISDTKKDYNLSVRCIKN